MLKTGTVLLAFAFVLLAAPPFARAQEPTPEIVAVTTSDFAHAESWGARKDQRVVLANVKFRGIFGGKLDVAGVSREKLTISPAAPADLAGLLAGWRTRARNGRLDTKGHSNVRIDGVARDQNGRTLEVLDVTLLPDDVAAFTERARAFEHDPARALALAREAVTSAEQLGEPELREWARATSERALDERRRTLDAKDFEARIELARAYRSVADVTSQAIAVLGEVARDPGATPGVRERAVGLLQGELDAVRHRGRWITHAELRREMGFVLVSDATGEHWVRRSRVELDSVVAERRAHRTAGSVLRTEMAGKYEQAIQTGEPILGLSQIEVSQARGLGYPVMVERTTGLCGVEKVVWERWDLADGRVFYFENGELFLWKAAKTD